MATLSPGTLLPAADAEHELTLVQAAEAMGIHARRLRRWLASWMKQNVAGIRKVPHPGGYAYAIASDLPQRWEACELPSPHEKQESGGMLQASSDDPPQAADGRDAASQRPLAAPRAQQ